MDTIEHVLRGMIEELKGCDKPRTEREIHGFNVRLSRSDGGHVARLIAVQGLVFSINVPPEHEYQPIRMEGIPELIKYIGRR